jgi:hypothetical protein
MNNPKKLAKLGTQEENKQNKAQSGADPETQHLDRTQVIPTCKGPLQERSLDIGRALKTVNLIQSSLDCRTNVEQFNHQCFARSA